MHSTTEGRDKGRKSPLMNKLVGNKQDNNIAIITSYNQLPNATKKVYIGSTKTNQ